MAQSDAELVARVQQGDIEAFGTLVARYEKSVLAAALADLRNLHSAEDVVQAAMLRAFQRLDTLRDASKFGPWLMQIARRQVADTMRTRLPVTVPVEDCEADATTSNDPLENDDLLETVARLPDHERVLISLRYFDGHSTTEIADITGRPLGTVTKQLSRAIARLRSWCEKETLS